VSNYETREKKRNFVVGLFAAVGLAALVLMIYKFGDLPTTISKLGSFEVFVQFPAATGVERDTPVRFCGYQIGRVTAVMAPWIRRDLNTGLSYHQTVVVLSIDKKYVDIPSNVEVKLMTRGLGSSYIELAVDPLKPLLPRDPNQPETKFLINEMMLQGSTGMTSEFFPAESQKKLDELATGLKEFIDNANDILGDPENKEHIKSALANISKAAKQAEESLSKFEEFSSASTAAVKSVDKKTDQLVVTLINAGEQLAQTSTQLRIILEKINTGRGSAGRFINDGQLYENMLETTDQLDLLVRDIRQLISKNKGVPIKLK
jgi:ABC-type transporter Mla subunit MlaD